MTTQIAYQSHPKAYFSNFRDTFILNNPLMVLSRFFASGDQNIHAKAAKKPPQKEVQQKFQEKPTHYFFFDKKLGNRRSKCTPKVPQIAYKSSPGPPWDSKVAQAIPESCPKSKKYALGMRMAPDAPKKYHARLTNVAGDAKKDKTRKQRWHCL